MVKRKLNAISHHCYQQNQLAHIGDAVYRTVLPVFIISCLLPMCNFGGKIKM